MDCNELLAKVQILLVERMTVRPLVDDGCLLTMPFYDSDGDPIRVAVYNIGELVKLTDVGIVAGHLFSCGQHTPGTPAFELLNDLSKAYGVEMDFENGELTNTVAKIEMYQAILDFSKVIITMITAIPHLPSREVKR